MAAWLEEGAADSFAVCGELDFESVATLWRQSMPLFRQQAPRRIDLAGVNRSDSSGVALLVEWLRQAKARGQPLQFTNIPPQMLAIVQVSDLDDLLPLSRKAEHE